MIYLEVDMELCLARLRRRHSREHSEGDIHEADRKYLERCLETARRASEYFGWTTIACRDAQGREREIDEKNQEIFERILALDS